MKKRINEGMNERMNESINQSSKQAIDDMNRLIIFLMNE